MNINLWPEKCSGQSQYSPATVFTPLITVNIFVIDKPR